MPPSARNVPSARPQRRSVRRQPTAPSAEDTGFANIRAFVATMHAQHQKMVAAHTPVVEHLIQSRSRDNQEIERTLDYLLGCACIPEGLAIFKSLCRYYFTLNPTTTAYYVYAYRGMWDDEADQGGAA